MKAKELAEKIYYRRTGLDTTKEDHEKNVDYATELINQFKKEIELETLKDIQFSFKIQSDLSCKTNGYKKLSEKIIKLIK